MQIFFGYVEIVLGESRLLLRAVCVVAREYKAFVLEGWFAEVDQ